MPQVPKAELHVHLENTVTPRTARRMAARHGIALPPECFDARGDYAFSDFPEFLALTGVVATCMRTPQDYYDVAFEYLEAARRAGVIYQELIFWPEMARQNGMDPEAALDAVESAIAASRSAGGPFTTIQIVLVRHSGAAHCESIARWAAGLGRRLVRAVNLAGNEVTHPSSLFAEAFAIARDAGLGIVVHAGEAVGPESVREALQIPGVTRIGHGVRAIEDAALVSELVARDITLEVCPTSNVALKFYASLEQHPFRALYDAGVRLTLNSDDPPFFHATLAGEYAFAAETCGLDDRALLGLTRNAIAAGFLTPDERALLLGALPGQ